MYFRIPLLLLLLATIAMVTSQNGVPATGLPSRDQSVVSKCASFIENGVSTGPRRWELLPLKTLCHPNIDKYFDCILAGVYQSNSILDIHVRSASDISKAKDATKRMCRETSKLKEPRFCNVTFEKCKSSFRPSSRITKDSALFCKMRHDRRCIFKEFAKCDLQWTMLWAKYDYDCLSIGCLLSDPKIQLIPSYGPELKCYSSIKVDDTEPTDYSQIHERYCDQFDYTEVSTCVEDTLSNVTSDELWEDKQSYMNKARQFVNDRRTLCRKLATLPSRKCLNPSYKPDVSICQTMLFFPPGPSNYSFLNYIKYYAECVKLIYFPCNLNMGSLISSNLITYS